MPDELPLVEQIARAVKTILEGVTIANGYAVDVVEVVRPTRFGGFKPRHGLIVLEQDDWGVADGGSPHQVVRRTLPMQAQYFCKPSDGSADPIGYLLNMAEADIEKALVADRKLGGLAQHLAIMAPETFMTPDGAFEGRSVNFEVTYRHAANDPYTPA